MKRILLLLTLLSVLFVSAQERSETIVFVNGQRFYVHHTTAGETIYSLSKLYGVEQGDITNNNTSIKDGGLKSGVNIKIPIKESAESPAHKELDKKLRKNFTIHTVAHGQTLYSISRQYEVSISTIIEDNASINPSTLELGQKILIRKKEVGRSSENEAIEEMREYTSEMNRIAPKGYEYYAVPPRQTLYSLLLNTKMNREEFLRINSSHSGELRAGEIVMVRAKEVETQASEEIAIPREEILFRALDGTDTLHVSLLLPLTNTSGGAVSLFEEFYQGFLMGCAELKEQGRSVDIALYNTQRDSLRVREIIQTPEFQASDLIVGPVYEELLAGVLPFAEENSVPVVSPLATLQSSQSDVLFQMAPLPAHRYDKIGGLLSEDIRVTLIYSDNIDPKYEEEVKEMLYGREYTTHLYQYEHPSVITERVREARRLAREEALEQGVEEDAVEIEVDPSPSDLTPLMESDTLTTFFILSDNETDVDRILSALASAESGLRSRSQRVCKFRVVNNPQWNRYPNIDRAMLFRANVVAFSSYHARRDVEVIRTFDSEYVKAFGVLPSLFSYRGYDAARIFCEGMFSDIEYGMEGRTFCPLQTTYRFVKMQEQNRRTNQNWMRVNYLPNFTINLE